MKTSLPLSCKSSIERIEHWDLLGAVRFALAFIVMVTHLQCFSIEGSFQEHITRFCAFSAVLCFLVISGFSIAASLDRDTRHFYRRRLARVYPLYLICIVQGVVFAFLAHVPYPATVKNVGANMLFLQTFVAQPLGGNAVVWTLGVEVFFYALAPWLNRLSSTTLLAITAASAAAYLAYPSTRIPTYYGFLNFGQASLFLGWCWIGGFLYFRHRHLSQAGVILLASMIVLTTYNHIFIQRWSQMTIVFSMGLLIAGRSIVISPSVRRVFRFLGDISFPLYLVHFPIFRLAVLQGHFHSPYVLLGSAFVFAMLCLWVDYRVRKPFTELLNWTDSKRCEAAAFAGRGIMRLGAFTNALISPAGVPLTD